jgi:hypothetical protein
MDAWKGQRLTNKIDDAVGHAQGTGGLDAPAELDNLGAELAGVHLDGVGDAPLLQLEAGKVLAGQVDEAGADVLADQVLACRVLALGGHLDLQAAGAEAEVHDGLAALGLAGGGAGGVPLVAHAAGAGEGAGAGIVLLHLVVARDAQVDAALADKGGDVGGGEEDEGDGQVLDQGDVEAVLTAELDVGALEEVQGRLKEATLWRPLGVSMREPAGFGG